jgi:hypothetical protein
MGLNIRPEEVNSFIIEQMKKEKIKNWYLYYFVIHLFLINY